MSLTGIFMCKIAVKYSIYLATMITISLKNHKIISLVSKFSGYMDLTSRSTVAIILSYTLIKKCAVRLCSVNK